MTRLKSYLLKLFVIISITLSLIISIIDSLFDQIATQIHDEQLMIIAIIIYFLLQATLLFLSALLFARLSAKEITKVNEEAQKETNLLFANIAHDLKTPLTTVIGYSKALRDDVVDSEEERKNMLTTVVSKAERVNLLLDVMFEYTKLNSTDLNLSLGEYDLTKLVRQIVAEYYHKFDEKDIQLEIEIPTDPIMLSMDKIEMTRAITNLIVNAYTHNKKQSMVMIQIIYENENQVKLLLADNGLSIPKERAENLFKPFYKSDDARNNNTGSGLGLSITKAILEKHEYRIGLEGMKDDKYTKAFMIYFY